MSMSEFERYMHEPEDGLSHLLTYDRAFPEDFSAEDMEFAKELDSLFDLGKEEIPPYFVQTLLESDDPRFQTLEEGFEKKTRARVFRRLDLHRTLFRSSSSPLQTIANRVPVRRFALTASVLLIMVLSILYTAPSFASGLAMLLAGPHSGVIQVHNAPKGLYSPALVTPPATSTPAPTHTMSLLQAQRLLHFSMYWPLSETLPNNYELDNIYIYNNADQSWADGPIMRLDYDYFQPGMIPRPKGHIAIYEFKPLGKVYQMVQLGAASQLKIDPHGNASAIYVDGEWTTIDQSSHTWIYNDRSELIYERGGVIFWIVGHQHDGITKGILSNIASSLQVFDVNYYTHMGRHDDVMQNSDSVPDLIAGNIIYLDNPDNPNGPTLQVVGANNSPHLQKNIVLDN